MTMYWAEFTVAELRERAGQDAFGSAGADVDGMDGPHEDEWSLYATLTLDDGRALETILHHRAIMNPPHRAKLAARIAEVAGHALSTRQVVTPIEVLAGIGWLPAAQVESWRRGRVADANLAKLNAALRLLAGWARQQGLTPSETVYVSWTRDRRRLRFTKTGDTHLERA